MALGAVGECAIAIVRVIPVLKCGEIPMNASDEGIAAVVTCGEGDYISDADELHVQVVTVSTTRSSLPHVRDPKYCI
jgi:hypothetical protein